MHYREAAEQAARQQRREAEALARREAAKKSAATVPERTAQVSAPIRADSSERPFGPPRLALAGNKPTWRDRMAQKGADTAGAAPTQAPSAAPPSDNATSEAQLPRKTGYVPPALRADGASRGRTDVQPPSAVRDESSGGETPAKWRPSARRDESGRDGSPAERPSSRFAELRRAPADGQKPEAPAEGSKPAPGKYVPMHMRNKGA